MTGEMIINLKQRFQHFSRLNGQKLDNDSICVCVCLVFYYNSMVKSLTKIKSRVDIYTDKTLLHS